MVVATATRRRTIGGLVLAVAVAFARPAGAAWHSSPASGISGQTLPLHGVAMASRDLVVAVGGLPAVGVTPAAPFVVKSLDGFRALAGAELVGAATHGAADELRAICVLPGTERFYAFGTKRSRFAWDPAAGWSNPDPLSGACPGCSSFAMDLMAAQCLADRIYLGGVISAPTSEPFVAEWLIASPDAARKAGTLSMPLVQALAFWAPDQGYLASELELFRYDPFVDHAYVGAAPATVRGLASGRLAEGDVVLAVGHAEGADTGFLQRVTPAPAASLPPELATAAFRAVHLTEDGFAVAVGRGGLVAHSADAGKTWRRAGSGLTIQDLNAVTCWRSATSTYPESCVAVGDNATILYYRNDPPLIATTGFYTAEQAPVTLAIGATDPDEDPLTYSWTVLDEPPGSVATDDPIRAAVDGSSQPAPAFTPDDRCSGRTYRIQVTVDDGRGGATTRDVFVTVEDTVHAPPTAPTGPTAVTWQLGRRETLTPTGAGSSCNSALSYLYSLPASDPPSPLAGVPTAPGANGALEYDLTAVRTLVRATRIEVIAQDALGQSASPLLVDVTLTAAPEAPVVPAPEYRPAARISGPGSIVTTLAPTHPYTTLFDFVASGGCTLTVARGTTAEASFVHSDTCTTAAPSCVVTVTPVLPPEVVEGGLATQVTLAATFDALAPTLDPLSDIVMTESEAARLVEMKISTVCPGTTYAWSCTARQTSPVNLSLGTSATATVPRLDALVPPLCTDLDFDCSASATVPGFSVPPQSFVVSYRPTPVAAVVPAPTVAPAPQIVQGESATLTLAPQHRCAADLTYQWSCSVPVGLPVTVSGGSAVSQALPTNPGGFCTDQRVSCSVVVTAPKGPTTTVDASLDYLAQNTAPQWTSAPISVRLGDGGASRTATVAATHAGGCGLQYSWRCDPPAPATPGLAAPETSGLTGPTLVFAAHPGKLCEDVTVRCWATALAVEGGHDPSSELQVTAVYEKTPPDQLPPTLRVDYTAPGPELAEGQGTQATVTAQHCPGASFSYRWLSCAGSGVTAPADLVTAALSFQHPGKPLCDDDPREATCTVEVTPKLGGVDHAPATQQVAVQYQPAYDPPSVFAIELQQAGDRPGQSVAALIDSCGRYLWRASIKSTGEVIAERTGARFDFPIPPVCGRDAMVVSATEELGGHAEIVELPVASEDGAPAVAGSDAYDFLPGPEPEMDCAEPQPVIIRPRVKAACAPHFGWSAEASLPLRFENRPGGEIEVRVAPEDLASVLGRRATFSLQVSDAAGVSEPERFEVRFMPKRYLTLDHRSQKLALAGGETAELAVEIRNGCEVPIGPVDLHLELLDLGYVPGSAKRVVAGEESPMTPDWSEGEWVFRNVELGGRGDPSPVIRYLVRRATLPARSAQVVARAYLSAAPDLLVSEGALDPRPRAKLEGVQAISCGCATGGAGEPVAFMLLAMVAVGSAVRGRRSRPRRLASPFQRPAAMLVYRSTGPARGPAERTR